MNIFSCIFFKFYVSPIRTFYEHYFSFHTLSLIKNALIIFRNWCSWNLCNLAESFSFYFPVMQIVPDNRSSHSGPSSCFYKSLNTGLNHVSCINVLGWVAHAVIFGVNTSHSCCICVNEHDCTETKHIKHIRICGIKKMTKIAPIIC